MPDPNAVRAGWTTSMSIEQIEDQIARCDQNIALFTEEIRKQEELKQDLLLMKLSLPRSK